LNVPLQRAVITKQHFHQTMFLSPLPFSVISIIHDFFQFFLMPKVLLPQVQNWFCRMVCTLWDAFIYLSEMILPWAGHQTRPGSAGHWVSGHITLETLRWSLRGTQVPPQPSPILSKWDSKGYWWGLLWPAPNYKNNQAIFVKNGFHWGH
jgi:hypothetical protein